MITGDFTGVLYAVIVILGVLLACYGGALLVSYRATRPRQERKQAQPTMSTGAQQAA